MAFHDSPYSARQIGENPNERVYRLRPRLPAMLLGILFFGACFAILGHEAMNNDVGLILNGVAELSIDGATTFYWVLAGLSAAFVGVAAVALIASSLKARYVRLTEGAIHLSPTLWSNRPRVIAYEDATEITRRNVVGQEFLIIRTPDTKIEIAQVLTGKDELEELAAEVKRRCTTADGSLRSAESTVRSAIL